MTTTRFETHITANIHLDAENLTGAIKTYQPNETHPEGYAVLDIGPMTFFPRGSRAEGLAAIEALAVCLLEACLAEQPTP